MIPERFAIPLQALFYFLTDRERMALMRIKTQRLTYLAAKDLFNLYDAAKSIEQSGVGGLFVEAGCALGGSAIAIGKAKRQPREFRIYDAFGRIPPPSEKDGDDVHRRYAEIVSGGSKGLGNDLYYGYVENLQGVVTANLAKHGVPAEQNNIKLIKGYFEDTLYITEPVAFAHIDCDWYASVMNCLMQIEPHLSAGGKIIFDDYYEWSGCRTAVDEYFADKDEYRFDKVGRKLHVTRS